MIETKWFFGDEGKEQSKFIRRTVFIDEQSVPEEIEFDDKDDEAYHLMVYDKKEPIATGRIIVVGDKMKLGRIAVLEKHRKKGYGDLIVRMLIRKSFELGYEEQYLNAQYSALDFYKKIGFIEIGDIFDEAGIEHIKMIHKGDVSGNCS